MDANGPGPGRDVDCTVSAKPLEGGMSHTSVAAWRGAPSPATLVGLIALFCAVGSAAALAWRVVPALSGVAAVAGWLAVALLLLLALGIAILLWGVLTLRYALTPEGADRELVIRWAWTRISIPIVDIEYFGLARHLVRPSRSYRAFPWPGYYLSGLDDESLGRISVYATLPVRRQLVVCSSRGAFGISPDRPADMMAAVADARRAAEPLESWELPEGGPAPTVLPRRPTPLSTAASARELEDDGDDTSATSLLRDRITVALVLAAGALVTLMLWFIVLRFDRVPAALPLHYSATGQPDRIGAPREIFILPLIAALAAVGNIALASSVIRYDRFAARLLTGGTLLVQVVAWVALLKLF